MIYLFKGNENFLTNIKIQRIVKESKVDPFNITTYDCSEVDLEKVIFDCCTPAFLGGKKIVIIKNPNFLEAEKSSQNTKILLNYLLNPYEDTILIINTVNLKLNEKNEILKALTKHSTVINTNGISEVEFSGWLKRECDTQNVAIEKNAINLFYKTTGNDLEQARNELDKIIAFINYEGTITEELANDVLCKGNVNDIYSLTNAIFDKNKIKVLSIYKEFIKYQNDISNVINLVSKSMRDTLIIKELTSKKLDQNEVATYMKISPNRAYYLIKNANSFDSYSIKKYINELADLDYRIKSGQIEMKIGFEQFLLGL